MVTKGTDIESKMTVSAHVKGAAGAAKDIEVLGNSVARTTEHFQDMAEAAREAMAASGAHRMSISMPVKKRVKVGKEWKEQTIGMQRMSFADPTKTRLGDDRTQTHPEVLRARLSAVEQRAAAVRHAYNTDVDSVDPGREAAMQRLAAAQEAARPGPDGTVSDLAQQRLAAALAEARAHEAREKGQRKSAHAHRFGLARADTDRTILARDVAEWADVIEAGKGSKSPKAQQYAMSLQGSVDALQGFLGGTGAESPQDRALRGEILRKAHDSVSRINQAVREESKPSKPLDEATLARLALAQSVSGAINAPVQGFLSRGDRGLSSGMMGALQQGSQGLAQYGITAGRPGMAIAGMVLDMITGGLANLNSQGQDLEKEGNKRRHRLEQALLYGTYASEDDSTPLTAEQRRANANYARRYGGVASFGMSIADVARYGGGGGLMSLAAGRSGFVSSRNRANDLQAMAKNIAVDQLRGLYGSEPAGIEAVNAYMAASRNSEQDGSGFAALVRGARMGVQPGAVQNARFLQSIGVLQSDAASVGMIGRRANYRGDSLNSFVSGVLQTGEGAATALGGQYNLEGALQFGMGYAGSVPLPSLQKVMAADASSAVQAASFFTDPYKGLLQKARIAMAAAEGGSTEDMRRRAGQYEQPEVIQWARANFGDYATRQALISDGMSAGFEWQDAMALPTDVDAAVLPRDSATRSAGAIDKRLEFASSGAALVRITAHLRKIQTAARSLADTLDDAVSGTGGTMGSDYGGVGER